MFLASLDWPPFTELPFEGPKSHWRKACVVRMLRCWVRDGEAHIMLRLPRMSRWIGPDGNLATAGERESLNSKWYPNAIKP